MKYIKLSNPLNLKKNCGNDQLTSIFLKSAETISVVHYKLQAVTKLITDIMESNENRETTMSVFLDLSKLYLIIKA